MSGSPESQTLRRRGRAARSLHWHQVWDCSHIPVPCPPPPAKLGLASSPGLSLNPRLPQSRAAFCVSDPVDFYLERR